MRLNPTWPWVMALVAGSTWAAGENDLAARCAQAVELPAAPFSGSAYGQGHVHGQTTGSEYATHPGPEPLDIDGEARRLADQRYHASYGRRQDYLRGFADGFEAAFCEALVTSRRSRPRRVWDPGLGRYREEKPGRVWDPALGRYREEKPGQVWDPALGRYRDRDPRDGPPSPRSPGRHRHAGEKGWCVEKH